MDLNCYGNCLDPSLKGLHLKLLEKFDETKEKLGNSLQQFISEETEELGWEENEGLADKRSKLKKLLIAEE